MQIFNGRVRKGDLHQTLKDEIDNKVNKDGSKVLSTNDFTDELKQKLSKIDETAPRIYYSKEEPPRVNGTFWVVQSDQ